MFVVFICFWAIAGHCNGREGQTAPNRIQNGTNGMNTRKGSNKDRTIGIEIANKSEGTICPSTPVCRQASASLHEKNNHLNEGGGGGINKERLIGNDGQASTHNTSSFTNLETICQHLSKSIPNGSHIHLESVKNRFLKSRGAGSAKGTGSQRFPLDLPFPFSIYSCSMAEPEHCL